jgi:sterol desaturase/sphingolipid hydroxylase (fatty acid hydroxylase superfamily)
MEGDSYRSLFFILSAIAVCCAELLAPRRDGNKSRLKRWPVNFGIVFIGALLCRIVLPILPVGLAVELESNHWGVLPALHIGRPYDFIISIVIFDLAIYFQHRAFHHFKILWMLHRTHHADTVYDFSTGIRFHPFEILLSTFWKMLLVFIIGPPASAVLVFEIILNSLAMFNHANLKLSLKFDSFLRLFIVTPDTHRVHHSVYFKENNSNFGFNVPWWDRLFKTYIPQPEDGHENMKIGLNIFRSPEYLSFYKVILIPFIKP